jgi:hypothetical protein
MLGCGSIRVIVGWFRGNYDTYFETYEFDDEFWRMLKHLAECPSCESCSKIMLRSGSLLWAIRRCGLAAGCSGALRPAVASILTPSSYALRSLLPSIVSLAPPPPLPPLLAAITWPPASFPILEIVSHMLVYGMPRALEAAIIELFISS